LKKKYIYADRQVLAQHDIDEGEEEDFKYFYLHDRLGSARLVIDDQGAVKNTYTYEPFGEMFATECTETTENPFKFTGQYFDSEIEEYYLRARQYNPHIARFTSRDPVLGQFGRPLTLHRYLYCGSDPIDLVDVDGRWAFMVGASATGNITLADIPGVTFMLSEAMPKMLSGVASMVSYYSVVLPVCTFLSQHAGPGGTAGIAFGVAKDSSQAWNKGWIYGTVEWVAAGGSYATGRGASANIDFAFSFEASRLADLQGYFTESGGSVGGLPIPLLGLNTAGFTYSEGIDEKGRATGINLWTGSVGWGSKGAEGHVFRGHAWVQEW